MLSVIAQRSLLAGFLAAGSPAVFALRSFEYVRNIEELRERNFSKPKFFIHLHPIIVVLEYLAAAASAGNIAELCYRLGGQAITATLTSKEYTFSFGPSLVSSFMGLEPLRFIIERRSQLSEVMMRMITFIGVV